MKPCEKNYLRYEPGDGHLILRGRYPSTKTGRSSRLAKRGDPNSCKEKRRAQWIIVLFGYMVLAQPSLDIRKIGIRPTTRISISTLLIPWKCTGPPSTVQR